MSRTFLRVGATVCALALLVGACSNDESTSRPSASTAPGATTGEASAGAGIFPADIVNQPVHDGTPQQGGEITWGVESDILDVSPNQNVIQPADVQMATAVFDPLLSYGDPDDTEFRGQPVTDNSDHRYNQLADRLEHSDDLKTWTLTLRDGVEFSNGEPVTAAQVVDHTKWVMASPECACATNAANIADVEADGDTTVVYTLKEPVVAFPSQITGGGLGWITESGARGDEQNPGIDELVGAGPFVYQSKSGDSYHLVRNDNYYGVDADNDDAPLPYLDKITFTPLADSVTRLQAVQSDSVQIMGTADTSNLVGAKKDADLKVQPAEGSSATILVTNLQHPPFGVEAEAGESAQDTAIRSLDDPTALKARQAFNYSINRNEINQKYYKGTRVPAYGFFPSSSPWFDENGTLPRYDKAKAEKLVSELKAAGAKTHIDAMCINTPEASGIFQILKDQGESIGISATLNQVEQAVLVQNLLSGAGTIDWDTSCFRSGQLSDPDGVYGAIVTGGPTNLVKYSRPDVDKWLDEARATADTAERKALYDKIQEQVAADVVIVPLLFDYWGNVFSKNISGLSAPSAGSLGIIRPGGLYRTQ